MSVFRNFFYGEEHNERFLDLKGSFWLRCSEKGYFCKFFKEFIIIDIDIKFVGLNKYTLEIHKKIFYSFQTLFIR